MALHNVPVTLAQIDEDIITFLRGTEFATNDAYLQDVLQKKVQELRATMAGQVPQAVRDEEAALPPAQKTKTIAIVHIIMGQPATYP